MRQPSPGALRGCATYASDRPPERHPAHRTARLRRTLRPGPGRSPRCPDDHAARPLVSPPPGRAARRRAGECPCRSARCRRHAPCGTRNRPPRGPSPARSGAQAARGSAAACCCGRPPRPARRPAARRPGPPAPARPPPASGVRAGCAAHTVRSGPRPAQRTSPPGSPATRRRTAGPAAGSPPAARRSQHRPAAAHTGYAPGPNDGRTPGTPPLRPAGVPRCTATSRSARPSPR